MRRPPEQPRDDILQRVKCVADLIESLDVGTVAAIHAVRNSLVGTEDEHAEEYVYGEKNYPHTYHIY